MADTTDRLPDVAIPAAGLTVRDMGPGLLLDCNAPDGHALTETEAHALHLAVGRWLRKRRKARNPMHSPDFRAVDLSEIGSTADTPFTYRPRGKE